MSKIRKPQHGQKRSADYEGPVPFAKWHAVENPLWIGPVDSSNYIKLIRFILSSHPILPIP